MNYRFCTSPDASLLALLNLGLIRDEGHRNPMGVAELEARMTGWLKGEYQAVLFEKEGTAAGYALFRRDSEFVMRISAACRSCQSLQYEQLTSRLLSLH